jgi:REP element-mobilizing transposase RayT
VPNLRTRPLGRLLFAAFGVARERFGMRLTHFSIQHNHLHLIVETAGKSSLSRAMQGFAIRIAKRLNARLGRPGRVFADRYHARALRNALEVRRAVRYVMNNYRRHHGRSAARPPRDWADLFSSADYFDGFLPLPGGRVPCAEMALGRAPPVVLPRTWLLRIGWKRLGLLKLTDVPGPPSAPG